MVFEKKLIILSGGLGAKGTLVLEKNAFGVFAALTVYNLPDLSDGEYFVGFKGFSSPCKRALGKWGRISVRFPLETDSLSSVHCVVFDSVREEPLLYGTNTADKLWWGNMMDGLREKQDAVKKEVEEAAKTEEMPSYSGRTPAVRDYFFDILPGERIEVPEETGEKEESKEPFVPLPLAPVQLPQVEETVKAVKPEQRETLSEGGKSLLESAREITSYNDSAIASVNYYAQVPITYSDLSSVGDEQTMNPIDLLSAPAVLPPKKARSLRGGKTVSTNSAAQQKESAFTVPPVSHYGPQGVGMAAVTRSNFFESVKDQINSLFESGERFKLLEELMEETRWVKINYDEKRYYAVGLIGKEPDYICYAVPGAYTPAPPEELGDNCRWLAQTPSDPEGKGFWLMFQDAETGEAI